MTAGATRLEGKKTMVNGFDFFGSFIRPRGPNPRRPKAKRFKGSKAAKRAHRRH